MKAQLRFHRQQPQKVRLVANLIRGKSVSRALIQLSFIEKRVALAMKKLIESAATNAKIQSGLDKDKLFIKEIRVGKGITFKRWMPRAYGRATPIRKRTSHITVVLEEQTAEIKSKKSKVKSTASHVATP